MDAAPTYTTGDDGPLSERTGRETESDGHGLFGQPPENIRVPLIHGIHRARESPTMFFVGNGCDDERSPVGGHFERCIFVDLQLIQDRTIENQRQTVPVPDES